MPVIPSQQPDHGNPDKWPIITEIVVRYRPRDGSEPYELSFDPREVDLLFWVEEYCTFFRQALKRAAEAGEDLPGRFNVRTALAALEPHAQYLEDAEPVAGSRPRRTTGIRLHTIADKDDPARPGRFGSEPGPTCLHYTNCDWDCTHGGH